MLVHPRLPCASSQSGGNGRKQIAFALIAGIPYSILNPRIRYR